MIPKSKFTAGTVLVILLSFNVCPVSFDYYGDYSFGLASTSSEGNFVITTYSEAMKDIFVGIKSDINANIYVAGYSSSFGGGDEDILLVKYSSQGDVTWSRIWGRSDKDRAEDLAIDNTTNDIYISGYSFNSLTSRDEMVVIKYTSDGDFEWVAYLPLGNDRGSRALGISVSNSSEIFITGYEWDIILINQYVPKLIIAKLTSEGDIVWTKGYSGLPFNGIGVGDDLVLDSLGNIFVVGYGFGNARDMILVKFDAAGNEVLLRNWNDTNDIGLSIVISHDTETIYCLGHTIQKGNFIVSYDLNGTVISKKKNIGGIINNVEDIDPTYDDNFLRMNIDIDPLSNIYLSGFSGVFGVGDNYFSTEIFNENMLNVDSHVFDQLSASYSLSVSYNIKSESYISVGTFFNPETNSYDGFLVIFGLQEEINEDDIEQYNYLFLLIVSISGALAGGSTVIAAYEIKKYMKKRNSMSENGKERIIVPSDKCKKGSLDYFVNKFEEIFGEEWENSEEKAEEFWEWLVNNNYEIEW